MCFWVEERKKEENSYSTLSTPSHKQSHWCACKDAKIVNGLLAVAAVTGRPCLEFPTWSTGVSCQIQHNVIVVAFQRALGEACNISNLHLHPRSVAVHKNITVLTQ